MEDKRTKDDEEKLPALGADLNQEKGVMGCGEMVDVGSGVQVTDDSLSQGNGIAPSSRGEDSVDHQKDPDQSLKESVAVGISVGHTTTDMQKDGSKEGECISKEEPKMTSEKATLEGDHLTEKQADGTCITDTDEVHEGWQQTSRVREQNPGAYHIGDPDPLPDQDFSTGMDDVENGARHNLDVPFHATVVEDPKEAKDDGSPDESAPQTRADLAVEAVPFKELRQSYARTTRLHLAVVAILVVAVVVVLALGLTGAFEQSLSENDPSETFFYDTPQPTPQPSSSGAPVVKSTLQIIREEGLLKCDLAQLPPQHQGLLKFMATMCEAVSAAIFGTPQVEFVGKEHPGQVQFQDLIDKKIHLMTFGYIFTMERNVYESTYQSGFAFSFPYLYEGMRLAGDTFYVESCVDKDLKHFDECQDMLICVADGSPYHRILAAILPRRNLFLMESYADIFPGFLNETCNLYAGSSSFMHSNETIRSIGYTRDFAVSNSQFSKEPLAIVTRNNDPEWSDFVNSVLVALQVAEDRNITHSTADMFPQTDLFGRDYKDMFRNAIKHAGNLGELHERFLTCRGERAILNHLNNGETGLLYSLPFGSIGADRGDDVVLSDVRSDILSRGQLRCGVRVDRQGFATKSLVNETATVEYTYRGIEVDFCIALAASLFRGGTERDILFVELTDQTDGFKKLASGQIDVFAGATWNLENDVREKSTGLGFSFSPPYFYGYSSQEDNLALAVRQDDHDWSTFVYWIVSSIINAEERGIEQEQSIDMPEMLLYGPNYNRLLRDAILAVGSYKNLYERNLQEVIPRGGRNTLNANPNLGGQHYVFPGVLGN